MISDNLEDIINKFVPRDEYLFPSFFSSSGICVDDEDDTDATGSADPNKPSTPILFEGVTVPHSKQQQRNGCTQGVEVTTEDDPEICNGRAGGADSDKKDGRQGGSSDRGMQIVRG